MVWRIPGGAAWLQAKGEPNRRAFRQLIESGAATGVLAFAAKEAVGWLSIAPRRDFVYFDTARTIPSAVDDNTWSVTCFFVRRGWRRQGVSTALLAAGVNLARRKRARLVEGYPLVPKSEGTQVDAFIWTGLPPLFEAAGFERAASAGARVVYRLNLRS